MTCRRVRRAGVCVELPPVVGDLPVGAGFDFLLVLFDAGVVDWTAFRFFRERARAGDDGGWGCVSGAVVALPVGVVGAGLTGPAGGVGVAPPVPIRIRAIAALSQRITWPQQA